MLIYPIQPPSGKRRLCGPKRTQRPLLLACPLTCKGEYSHFFFYSFCFTDKNYKKLHYRTELVLEETGVSVALPAHSHSTTRMPPPPTQVSNLRQRRSDQAPNNVEKLETTQEKENESESESGSNSNKNSNLESSSTSEGDETDNEEGEKSDNEEDAGHKGGEDGEGYDDGEASRMGRVENSSTVTRLVVRVT